ncbi:MAG TPA: hypothetical protein VIN59_06615 [Alphaproteobacteria bacterium]
MEQFTEAAGKPVKIVGVPKAEILSQITTFGMKADLGTAIFIASSAFSLKKTWNGEPYITHCLFVADLNNEQLTDEEKTIGVLHDLIEDTDWDYADLKNIGFSDYVIEGVRALTKDKESGEKYFDGMRRCSHNPIGRFFKRRDNKHNMDLTRSARMATAKQKYHYHISATYHKAVDQGVITAGTSLWKFLKMKQFSELLTAENFPLVLAETSEPAPNWALRRFATEIAGRKMAGLAAHA